MNREICYRIRTDRKIRWLLHMVMNLLKNLVGKYSLVLTMNLDYQ